MPVRLVALDEGPDITIDRDVLIVGRHPTCDARLDSIRVSRRHCCMIQDQDNDDVIVRDLGSTNGIRINGQRVEKGTLRPGDELSIAHIRYRMEVGSAEELTLAETMPSDRRGLSESSSQPLPRMDGSPLLPMPENPLAAAVRELLPAAMADRCRIQVIVQMPEQDQDREPSNHELPSEARIAEPDASCPHDSSPSSRE